MDVDPPKMGDSIVPPFVLFLIPSTHPPILFLSMYDW